MSAPSVHDDWLSLIEISGPFLAVPVLKEAFPQGLEELNAIKRKRLRQAYEEWREALELEDAQFGELHAAWINEVLSRGLELDEDGKGDVLKRADWCAANLQASLPEHGATLSPDLAVVDEQRANKPLMLIHTYAQDVDLDATLKQNGWAATPADRMVALCRTLGCRLGLVTNGERWMLVDAPVGAVTTFASWYARIWNQEPITLQAYVHLLSIRRFFVDESEQLPALFDRSLKFQDEVTDALGEQVRRAVEVLIQTLDKADQDRNRELLHGVKEPELYEAALTVMMRLVFLLSAEERGLLLMGDERYEANYALSTLRMQLRKESEEILERRWDAWSRLLAIFRAVFGGIEHENLRLPALGGSLFDPDRFPFLEGRAKGSNWRNAAATPLPIDNRTVLLLLEAIQQFQGRTLSYRALDVEQIGYVYEGLLERTVKRTAEVTLELDGTKSAQSPWVTLAELESAQLDGAERLAELLQERSGSSASRVRNDLNRAVDDALADRVLTACHGNTVLRDRIKPFCHLVRTDPWGYPLVYPAGAFIVTTGSDRRETGTHYTPKSLTETIVSETLTPIAYVGPAEGAPRSEWALKSPAELLDLKICDPAMGSGAFLVQACRWLADRLVEAWAQAEARGSTVAADGRVVVADASSEPMPRDTEARTILARRLIAERCLYGVDLNPLAVELAKLSIWLVTLAKWRPFGFLDHNLRCGDSLLGIHKLDYLTQLSMNPTGQGQLRLFGQNIERAVLDAIELRQQLRKMPIRDIRDVEVMAHLDADARHRLEIAGDIADAFVGDVLTSGSRAALENALISLTVHAENAIDGGCDALASIQSRSVIALMKDLPAGKPARRPFHWALEFPEAFSGDNAGFDAIIGNPPFLGGKKITSITGEVYREYLVNALAEGRRGNADLLAYFVLRADQIANYGGCIGLVCTNSIAEGDTREVALDRIVDAHRQIVFAVADLKWPGAAALTVSLLVLGRKDWTGRKSLNGSAVDLITSSLKTSVRWSPVKLARNKDIAFQGSIILGSGFTMPVDAALEILAANPSYRDALFPYLIGRDLNSDPAHAPSRWVISFWDWSLEKASNFPELLEKVQREVRPEREAIKTNNSMSERYRKYWWQHGVSVKNLYHKIGRGNLFEKHVDGWGADRRALPSVIACATQASKYCCFAIIDNEAIFSNALCVIADYRASMLGLLSSSIHEVWAWEYGSRLEDRLRYSHGDVFETFPLPDEKVLVAGSELDEIGRMYSELRGKILRERNIGLTAFYNSFHQIGVDGAFSEARILKAQLDEKVAEAYGWSDIDMTRAYREVPYLPVGDRIRFSISEAARIEVLSRLSELNRQQYEEEVAKGLQTVPARRPATHASRPGRNSSALTAQPGFNFEPEAKTAVDGSSPAMVILGFLSAHAGWHAKADILAATGIKDGQWNAAIADLMTGSRIERQGERRGARYRVKSEN